MCRFLAYTADRPLAALGLLFHDRNALVTQSCCDVEGEKHGDGWGLGWYSDATPQLVKRPTAASDDPLFRSTAGSVTARLAIGHVRQASVGQLSEENSHPFTFGPWLFAHNGTVEGFDQVKPLLEAEIGPALLAHRRGTTDSELVFLWILALLAREGHALDRPLVDPGDLVPVMCEALMRLANMSEQTNASETSKLNFLMSDGRLLLATRWNHSLHWLDESNSVMRRVVIASEPIGEAAWREMPDRSILLIDEQLQVQHCPV